MVHMDETHDPARNRSAASANTNATDFPLQNLLFGRFRRAQSRGICDLLARVVRMHL